MLAITDAFEQMIAMTSRQTDQHHHRRLWRARTRNWRQGSRRSSDDPTAGRPQRWIETKQETVVHPTGFEDHRT